MTNNGWMQSLKSQTATWFVGLVIACLGVFSGWITEQIRFGLNRAELRVSHQESLATEISQYIFAAELTTEFIDNNWTTKPTMTALLTDYNAAVTTLRKKEFVYKAWVKKYWSAAHVEELEAFFDAVRLFDQQIHQLNDEFEAVNILSETKDGKRINEERAEQAVIKMKPALEDMRKQGRSLLESL